MIHLKVFVTLFVVSLLFMALKIVDVDRPPTARDLGFGVLALVLFASGVTGLGALLSWVWSW